METPKQPVSVVVEFKCIPDCLFSVLHREVSASVPEGENFERTNENLRNDYLPTVSQSSIPNSIQLLQRLGFQIRLIETSCRHVSDI